MSQPSLFGEELPDRFGRMEVRHITAKTILTPATGRLGDAYDFSLNPYVGCGFSCSYCFATFFVPDEDRAAAWGTWVDVKANALALMRKTPGICGAKIFMGSVTDSYQPIERKTGLSRSLLEYMAGLKPQPRIVIQTRSDLPLRDVDILRRFEYLRVNVSLTTDDDAVRKKFEPSCLSVERRVEGLRKMKAAGLRTAVCLCPLLPVKDPEAFAQTLVDLKADFYAISTFHETHGRFAAGTRPLALQLAEEHGWTPEAYKETVRRMSQILPFGGAFNPE